MKTKRKNIFKSLLALTLALIMVLGVAPISELAGVDWASLFAPKAEAAEKTYIYDIYAYGVGSDGTITITGCDGSANGDITIPSQIDGRLVTRIGDYAFNSCKNLTSITIPDSVISIGAWTFVSCASLTSITIPGSVTSIGDGTFGHCASLTSINVVSNNNYYSDKDGVLFNKKKTELIQYPSGKPESAYTIPDGVTSVEDEAFASCYSIISITVPKSVTSIGAGAFGHCESLTSVNVASDNNYYSDKNGILFNKKKTELIQYPNGKTETAYTIPNGVTSIGDEAFASSHRLISITIPNGVTNIGKDAFSWCSNLTSITVPDSITSIGDSAFWECKSLTSVTIPDGVASIGYGTFFDCISLTSITIPDGVASIGDMAFSNCENLASITIHASVTSIGYGAFFGCYSLASITIPDGVTSIGNFTFKYCESLTSITIPNSVTSIGDEAFYYCNNLKDVYYTGSEAEWKAISVDKNNDCLLNANLHTSVYEENIYNLGDETYSFENFGDSDSPDGHCFGMSITSSGYYVGVLDRKLIGKDTSKSLHSFSREEAKKPICYYQDIQGSYSVRATVAGGSTYLTGKANISSDWNAVINYVKNHNYDNKGSLQIGFRKESEGGHAINFLYYKEVNGQQRIYAYDNNFPNIETYFYKGSNGKVYQAPQSTFSGSIDCIALRDVAKYYQFAGKYDASRCIYAATGTVDVKDYVCKSQMEGTLGGVEYTMYELSDDAETTVVVPLTDNATFSYLNNDYSFGEINDETYGVLTLAQSGDSATGDKADFNIANEPVKATGITLAAPTSPIPVGSSYQLVAAAQPDGASLPDLVWTSSDPSVASVDENGLVKALSVGTATISVTDSESKFSAEVEINTVQVIDFGDGPTIKVGEKLIYTPVIQEGYVDYHYRWSSSDPSVVTVEPNEGELTGIKEGTATITMTLVDDDGNIIASSDFTVTVEKKDGFFKILFRIITAPFRAIINLFKKLFGK